MWPLIKESWNDFWHNKKRARLWLKSFLGLLFGILVQVTIPGYAAVRLWGFREWLERFAIAALPMIYNGISSHGVRDEGTDLKV